MTYIDISTFGAIAVLVVMGIFAVHRIWYRLVNRKSSILLQDLQSRSKIR